MTNFKVGDRVQWWEEFKNTRATPRMMTGTIISSHGGWFGIKGDGEGYLGGTWTRNATQVTRMTDTELVAAVAAQPQDEDERETAISSLRWACDPADYDLLMAAGDLGGAEIDLWDMTL